MTDQDRAEQGSRPEDGDEQESKTVGGHSLAAATGCITITVTIALLAAFGLFG